MSETDDDCEILMVKKGRPRIKHEEQLSKRRSAADSAQHKIRLTMMAQCDNDSSSDSESSEESSSEYEPDENESPNIIPVISRNLDQSQATVEIKNDLAPETITSNFEPLTNFDSQPVQQVKTEENNLTVASNIESNSNSDPQPVQQSKTEETPDNLDNLSSSPTNFADLIQNTQPIPNTTITDQMRSTNSIPNCLHSQPPNINQNPEYSHQIWHYPLNNNDRLIPQSSVQNVENFVGQYSSYSNFNESQAPNKLPCPIPLYPAPFLVPFYPAVPQQFFNQNQFSNVCQSTNYAQSTAQISSSTKTKKSIAKKSAAKKSTAKKFSLKKPVEIIVTCKKCHELKPLYLKDMCFVCHYEMAQEKKDRENGIKQCGECGRFKKIFKRGFCKKCYRQITKEECKIPITREAICSECNQLGICGRRTTCKKCHDRMLLKKRGGKKNVFKICVECNKLKRHSSRGLCHGCWCKKFYTKRIIEKRKDPEYKKSNLRMCIECGEVKRHEAKGLCFHCAKRLIYNPNYQKACKERKEAKKLEKTKKSKERPLTSYFDNQIPSTSNNDKINLSSASENEDEEIQKEIGNELEAKMEQDK